MFNKCKKVGRGGWVFVVLDHVEFHIIDVVWSLFATKGYTPKIDQTALHTNPPLKVGLYTAYRKLGCIRESKGIFFRQIVVPFPDLHPGRLTAGTYKSPMKRKENHLPNLHEDMFQPFIFQGVLLRTSPYKNRISPLTKRPQWVTPSGCIVLV